MNENTVAIPAVPKPSTMLALGATTTTAVAAWTATLIGITVVETNAPLELVSGLSASVASTVIAVLVWARFNLARNAANHQRELLQVLAGQHAFVMAEIRSLRRAAEESAGRARAERQAISVKLAKILEILPTYYEGVADTVEKISGLDNVHEIGRARVPRHN